LIFVCMTLIRVKSKYGSCKGTCMGLMYQPKKYVFVNLIKVIGNWFKSSKDTRYY
jgi:hypothetical protein